VSEAISMVFMLVGAFLMFVAAVGIVRMPDLFTRMQANTKAATLGAVCVLVAVAVHFKDFGVTTRAVAIIVFFFLTAPVGAHMLGRAAYFMGVSLWEGTIVDELRGRYDSRTHVLEGGPVNPAGGESSAPPVAPH